MPIRSHELPRCAGRFALAALALLLAVSVPARSDEGPSKAAPTPSWIHSDPQGATVDLGGSTRMRGRTPWKLDDRIRGTFLVTASMPGYETWRGSVELNNGRAETYRLDLSPKKRSKALLRSLLIPGWGQIYAGSKGKGTLYILGEGAALVGYFITHRIYSDRADDWETARDAYLDERFEENLDARYRELAHRQERAQDAYDTRQVFAYGALGLAALNVLDILFFTPVGPASGAFTVAPLESSLEDAGQGPMRAQVSVGLHF